MREVRRCRPAISNETFLGTRQEFFLTKVAPVQSVTDIVLLNFWLMLLSWMSISSYTTIYFFEKKFNFLNVYISVNTIFECRYMFFGWERSHQLSTYAPGGKDPKCLHVYVRTYIFSCFRPQFSPIVSCFICRNLTFKFNAFLRNGYFCSTRSTSVVMK